MNEQDAERISALIEEIFSEEDFERQAELADEVLRLDPANPVAKYVKWQMLDDEESMENVGMLQEAVDGLRSLMEEHEEMEEDQEVRSVYASMLSDLASLLYFKGEKDRALDVTTEFMSIDDDGYLVGRLVYYSVLIEKGEYARVVGAADEDAFETPIAEYCRAIALFEQEGPSEDASDALLEAISLDPDMVFYIMGLWTVDEEALEEDEEGYVEELIMNVSVLAELWAASEERLAFLSAVAFAFGYMTGRMDDADDVSMLEDGYRTLSCLDEMQEARDTLHAMIASGKEQEEVDEEALMMIRDMRNQGLFN